MTTNYQAAREALGARLRELRTEAGLSGRRLALLLGWPPSKISKLETGRQTASQQDVTAWARIIGRPDAEAELVARLRALETHHSSWRRELSAGTRAKQDRLSVDDRSAAEFRNFETACVPGLLQSPGYARSILTHVTTLHRVPGDVDAGVEARMARQEVLEHGKTDFWFLIWEAALYTQIGPPDVMAEQYDKLAREVGQRRAWIGFVPFAARLRQVPLHSFLIYDDRMVRVENLGAEIKVTDTGEIADYRAIWERLQSVAVYGHEAHRLIVRAHSTVTSERRPS